MKAAETSLRNLLEGGKQFQIPLFQRPYAWEKKNWAILWEDIMNLYHEEVEGSYFMGSIVTQAISGTADGVSPFILIDGQQRLITLTILLATLRTYLIQKEKETLADELYELYLINKFKQNDDFYKVLPTQEDRTIYSTIISQDNNKCIDSNIKQNKIYEAASFFEAQIKKQTSNENNVIDFLIGLKTIVLERLSLVNITSEKDDNPYLIFESLNHKGQALTQADLVRNYIFMKLPTEQRENIYKEKWLPFQKEFKSNTHDNDYVNELTKAFWFYSRKDGIKVTQKEVYKAIKKRFDEADGNVLLELENLIKFSNYYQNLNFKNGEKEDRLKKCFKRINRLGFDTCHIFLLNVYDDYKNSKITLEDFEKILLCIESYLVRRFFIGISTQTLGNLFSKLYNEIQKENPENLVEGLSQVLISYKDKNNFPEDCEFRKSIIAKDIYKTNQKDRVKLILETIENYLCLEKVDPEKITIEHIMPQNLNDEWKNSLGSKYNTIHKEWVHKIGNLTLTGCNSSLSNKPFNEKKDIYQNSNLSLNKYFKDKSISNWHETEIKNRAEYLADIAIKIWSR